jgi:hypothetical protein
VIATIIETRTLAKVVLYSVVAGVGVAVIFGAGVSSAASLFDALREHRSGAGMAWGALTVLCLVLVLGVVVLGIVVMSTKS